MIFELIYVVLPVFIVIGFGYVLTRRGLLEHSQIDGLMKFAQGVAIPCLLFSAMATLDLRAGFEPTLMISFYGGAVTCFLLGILGARFVFKREWEDAVVIGFCCLFSNSLLLGLPITERAYGPENLLGNYAIIALHSPICYGLGVTAMEILRSRGQRGLLIVLAVLKGMFKNNLIVAIVAGFAVNLTGLTIPAPVDDALELLARAGLPTALFALGGVMVQYKPEGDLRTIAMVCCISLMLHPAIVWGLGKGFGVQTELFRSAVITAAMAPGINGYIFANLYGRAKRVAASSVLLATGACIATAMFWLILLP